MSSEAITASCFRGTNYSRLNMTSDVPTAEQVEAVLKGARTKSHPENADLQTVYSFLLPPAPPQKESTSASSSSSADLSHYYCSKCATELQREAATYLIFAFAFRRKDRASHFLGELEKALKGCAGCARAFGSVRRTFATT